MKTKFFKGDQTKKKLFLSLPFFIFFPQGFLGLISGYFLAKFLSSHLPSLIFDFGRIKFHLHHWLYSLFLLIFDLKYNLLPFSPFSLWFLSGVIFQGIYCYDDWHRVIIFKKKN